VLERYQTFRRCRLRIFIFVLQMCFCSSLFAATPKTSSNSFLHDPEVTAYIKNMVKEYKFKQAYLEMIFANAKVKQVPKLIVHINRPLEEMSWDRYRQIYVSVGHISRGKAFMQKYHDSLSRAEQIYGVPASILVATIGIESNYGKNIGKFRVLDTLTNLAFSHSHRKNFFKQELTDFLLLTREQHLNPLTLMGSYTGAIGLPQFMPSSYRHYAVSFDGDHSIDLADNVPDAIGSVAHYYQQNGWHHRQIIAYPTIKHKPSYGWFDRNVTTYKNVDCGWVPDNPMLTQEKSHCVFLRTNSGGEYWLGYHNFTVIRRYNHSILYAMAVYQLSYSLIR